MRPPSSDVRTRHEAYWWSWIPPSSAVATYAARLASVRATFVGQHETRNHGSRRLVDARLLSLSSGGTVPGTRWCSGLA